PGSRLRRRPPPAVERSSPAARSPGRVRRASPRPGADPVARGSRELRERHRPGGGDVLSRDLDATRRETLQLLRLGVAQEDEAEPLRATRPGVDATDVD